MKYELRYMVVYIVEGDISEDLVIYSESTMISDDIGCVRSDSLSQFPNV